MKTAFVICTRIGSRRVPGKVFYPLNGIPIIEHLVKRLSATGLDIHIAAPKEELEAYQFLSKYPEVKFWGGHPEDPLHRMWSVANEAKIDNVIRICHDKVFIDPAAVYQAIAKFNELGLDYLFSSDFPPGSSFEIISKKALTEAKDKFKGKNVEHISYAIRSITENVHNFDLKHLYKGEHPVRLLLDYPEDGQLLTLLFSALGNDCTYQDVLTFVKREPWVAKINRLPLVTVYTCVHNGAKFIEQCMGSVAAQVGFRDMEYIIIDDFSSDQTLTKVAEFAMKFKNVSWFRNPVNKGLASSSNIALKNSRGKYIIRLDADDFFSSNDSIQALVEAIEERPLDVVYPNNFFGLDRKTIQPGSEVHHIGGALFRKSAVNHVKFTDGLRGYEGFDFFRRAMGQIKIGYLNRPTFVYRQRPDSMSRTNQAERVRIKKHIEATT